MPYTEIEGNENIEQEEYIKQLQRNKIKKNKHKNKIKKIKEFLIRERRI